MRLLGYGEPAINLFIFFDGDPAKIRAAMDQGWVPWWTSPNLRHASLRYLSVLTMQLDYLLWPNSPFLMHLHSLLWLGALVVAAATALPPHPGIHLGSRARDAALRDRRRARGAGGVHREPQRADRDLSSASSACSASPDRGRKAGAAGVVLSPLFLALGLAAGEMALATAAYLAVLRRLPRPGTVAPPSARADPERARARCLGRDLQARPLRRPGFGVLSRSGREPVAFARALADRALYLLARPVDADRRRSRVGSAQWKCRGAPYPTRRGPDPGAPGAATTAAAAPRPK